MAQPGPGAGCPWPPSCPAPGRRPAAVSSMGGCPRGRLTVPLPELRWDLWSQRQPRPSPAPSPLPSVTALGTPSQPLQSSMWHPGASTQSPPPPPSVPGPRHPAPAWAEAEQEGQARCHREGHPTDQGHPGPAEICCPAIPPAAAPTGRASPADTTTATPGALAAPQQPIPTGPGPVPCLPLLSLARQQGKP